MKKFYKIAYLSLAILICSLIFVGCGKKSVEASFIRFSIKERQSDYCLDFTIKLDNNTKQDVLIDQDDFTIEINNEKKTDISFWSDVGEIVLLNPQVKSEESFKFIVRVISKINLKERNKILVLYKNKVLVDDNVYFSKN